jgi:hypothetical protein
VEETGGEMSSRAGDKKKVWLMRRRKTCKAGKRGTRNSKEKNEEGNVKGYREGKQEKL